MTKKFATLLLAVCLVIGTTGCSVGTTGKANWEIYGGVRHNQEGDKPAEVEIKSSVVDTIVDLLTDGEVSDEE